MKTKLVLSIAALCAAFAFTATDASARSIHRGGYAVGPHGRGGWSHSDVTREPGTVSGQRSFQGFNGRGGARDFQRGCSSGTCSYNSTTRTNNGSTWSRSGSAGNGSASWNRSATGPNGGNVSRSGNCTEGVGCSRTITKTGPNGNQTERSDWVTVE